MKQLSLLFLLIFFSIVVFSQDQLITTTGDTLDCKILKVNKKNIHFSIETNGIKTYAKLPVSRIKTYTKSSTKFQVDNTQTTYNTGKWQLELNEGFSCLVGETETAIEQLKSQGVSEHDAKSYYNKLVLGNNFKGSIKYMIKPGHGIGAHYRLFTAESSYNGMFDLSDGIHNVYGKMNENIFINFFGLGYYTEQIYSHNRLKFGSGSYFGFCNYRNEYMTINTPSLITGNTFALDLQLQAEYFIAENISLGVSTSFFIGNLRKIEFESSFDKQSIDLSKEEYENISAIDLSISFTIHL